MRVVDVLLVEPPVVSEVASEDVVALRAATALSWDWALLAFGFDSTYVRPPADVQPHGRDN
jgi:hypothetical protein